jgi:glycosyltransferase involved in cell wall biosynthesis
VIQKSLKEGFGLTVTEALWKGKPTIAGAVGGIPNQVIHKLTGVLVHYRRGLRFSDSVSADPSRVCPANRDQRTRACEREFPDDHKCEALAAAVPNFDRPAGIDWGLSLTTAKN